ncbi:MAG TPA: hypothetical protein VM912_02020 [Terriglobales bacterium]|nr:hypothetical protein [Terriglobales bacterium]
MNSCSRSALAVALLPLLYVGDAMPQAKPYPKPQIASAAGQAAQISR